MRRTLGIVLLLTLAAWAYNWPDNVYWGAIAYSPSTGKWGYSRCCLSDVNARRVAVANCGEPDAQLVLWRSNCWAALALGDDLSAYGVGWGRTREIAVGHAVEEAAKHTTGAHLELVFNLSDFDYP